MSPSHCVPGHLVVLEPLPSWHAHTLEAVSEVAGQDENRGAPGEDAAAPGPVAGPPADGDPVTGPRGDRPAAGPEVHVLDPADAAILDLEDAWQHGRLSGDKATVIHDRLEISSPRYHQRLNGLLNDPDAAGYAPALVNRLRRVRESSRQARSASHLG